MSSVPGKMVPTTLINRNLDIPALTGLRIVAAVWVVLYHFANTIYIAWPFALNFKPVLSQGKNGVPLFFLLSGYIIWHNYGSPDIFVIRNYVSFLWKRMARLWPVNLLTSIIAIFILYRQVYTYHNWGVAVPKWFSVLGWLKSALMLQQIGNPKLEYQWNQPAWSLTGELIAYIIFPVIVLLLLPLAKVLKRFPFVFLFLGLASMWLAFYKISDTFPYGWLINLILTFLSGCLMRISLHPIRNEKWILSCMQLVTPLIVLYSCYHDSTFVPISLFLWVYSLTSNTGPGVALFSTKFFQIAGQASYSLYMLQWSFLISASYLLYSFPSLQRGHLQIFALGTLSFLGFSSFITWKYFETPMRRRLNASFAVIWRVKQG